MSTIYVTYLINDFSVVFVSMVYDLFYVSQNQMEEPKERPNEPEMSNNIASPRQQVKKDIAEKLYQVLSFCESSIIQEIDKCKVNCT